MHALQHTMPRLVHFGASLLGGTPPSQEDHAPGPLLRNDIDDLLRELLPSLVRVAVGVVGFHCQAGVQ